MNKGLLIITAMLLLQACDENRVYEKNHDFAERHWLMSDQPTFEFTIADRQLPYTLSCYLRNSVAYPYSRIFIMYTLEDSLGNTLKREMITGNLFKPKTGEPFGTTGLGDLYDHQFPLLKDYTFDHTGKYKVRFEQFMRTDTLEGVLAVGLRVERPQ